MKNYIMRSFTLHKILLRSLKGGEFPDQLNSSQLLRKDFAHGM
jgi:hypothetical protein